MLFAYGVNPIFLPQIYRLGIAISHGENMSYLTLHEVK